jgi:zinc D-Ala-D-Ala carboxypeptidase
MTRERTEHFSKLELSCPCCGVMGMDQEFLGILEAVRKEYGKPMKLNSSFRCADHNAAIGAKSSSSHRLGVAVDISCEGSRQRYDLIRHLLKHVTRIGIGEGFIHADNDLANKSANVMWDYY